MGSPTAVILAVATPQYRHVVVDSSDGNRYHTDLASFESVYCFPKTEQQWQQVSMDSYGLALVWSSRFEVHLDQVIALAHKTEMIRRSA